MSSPPPPAAVAHNSNHEQRSAIEGHKPRDEASGADSADVGMDC
jgi:hypothetical protein